MNMTPRFSLQSGLTLIELMVAMVLGVLVSAGIVTVFASTSESNRTQTQLARLQEEGRFAVTQLKNDLSMSGATYCTNTGGNAAPSANGPYLDALRAPTVYASQPAKLPATLSDVTTPWGGTYPNAPAAPYSLPSFFAMRGYDCTAAACTPIDPSSAVSATGFGIPAMGITVTPASRVIGSSVITVRYINPAAGWTIMPAGSATGSLMVTNPDQTVSFTIRPLTGEPPTTNFVAGDLAMLADCSNAQIFAVTGGGAAIQSNGNNFTPPVAYQNMAAPKVFDLNHDFQTVTYWLQVVDNGDGLGHTTGALMRRVNGGGPKNGGTVATGTQEEIARGVERLDFKYGIQAPDGTMRYYDAATIDASTSANCPPSVPIPIAGSTDPGCLWRSVTTIQIDLLMDGQNPLYTLTPDQQMYTYASDTSAANPNGILTPTAPAGFTLTAAAQGFPVPMLRREFTAVAAVRNFNP